MDSYRGNLMQHEPVNPGSRGGELRTYLAGDDDIAREPPPLSVGQDERRMQVRAYNYWTSLLGDRPFPQIEDLTNAALPDFADHAVVLDFSQGIADPAVTMLGKKLAEECGAATSITRLSEVSGRSLLSRITDRYTQILANAAPIGFEAEFVNQRGKTLLYRGILLPFSGDGEIIAHIMGVINWKELADPIVTAELRHELESAAEAAHTPVSSPRLPTWADGPVAIEAAEPEANPAAWGVADQLAKAREAAEAASGVEERSRVALYAAIGRAWDLTLAVQADPLAFRDMIVAARLSAQPRAPLAAMVKLIFGTTYDKTRRIEFVLVLAHARRLGLECGGLPELLAGTPGGLKRIVRTERRLRRAETGGTCSVASRTISGELPTLASV